mmetsp:Transcript_73203/g.211847  ORF Transcript_73203/g.211847 Transcript_73203/m.211847 type:complete len:211 (+) Transcript_73203:352-984(+)
MCPCKVRSTFSQSHDQDTSCKEPQSWTSERSEASITDLNLTKVISSLNLARRSESTSLSSARRKEFEAFRTIVSKEFRISNIQLHSPKPITAALNANISSKLVGTVVLRKFRLPLSLLASSLPEPSLPPEPPDLDLDLEPNHELPFFGFAFSDSCDPLPAAGPCASAEPLSPLLSACSDSSASSTWVDRPFANAQLRDKHAKRSAYFTRM